MKSNLRKMKKLSKEIGYKKVMINFSDDKKYIFINNKKYLTRMIKDVQVSVSHYDSFCIPAGESENYNVLTGYLGYKVFDHPLGLLTGVEIEKTYEEVYVEKIELEITFKNNNIERYTTGIFLEEDAAKEECIVLTEQLCRQILDCMNARTLIITNEKFEYLKLSFGKTITNDILMIQKECEQLHIMIQSITSKKPKFDIVIEDNGFVNRIEQYHISNWNDRYVSEDGSGTQWYIDYKEKDKNEKNVYGYNAYPMDFFELLTVIKDIHPKIKKFVLNGLNDKSEQNKRNAIILEVVLNIIVFIFKAICWIGFTILSIIFFAVSGQKKRR